MSGCMKDARASEHMGTDPVGVTPQHKHGSRLLHQQKIVGLMNEKKYYCPTYSVKGESELNPL